MATKPETAPRRSLAHSDSSPVSGVERTARVLSALLIPLCLLATMVGLFVPGFYRGSPDWVLQGRAQDLVSLVVAVPLLTASLVLTAPGSIRVYLLWLGTVGYLIYSYAIFAFDVQFNALFLVYVAILGLALYSLVLGLAGVNPRAVAESFDSATPTGWIGGFLVGVCVLAALLWLSEDLPSIMGGRPPASLAIIGLPTNPIHVLDLAIVLPGGVATGLFLLRRRPWGYVLGGYYLVKFATLGLAINAINLFSLAAGQPIDAGPGAAFAFITVISIVITWLFLKGVHSPVQSEDSSIEVRLPSDRPAAVANRLDPRSARVSREARRRRR